MDDPRKLESALAERVAGYTRGISGLEDIAVLVRGTVTRPSRSLPGETAERPARTVDSSAPSSLLVGPALNLSGDEPRTLDEALRRAALLPDKGTVYLAGGEEPRFQSYRDLAESAGRVLGGLRARGVRPGDPVILQLRDNQDIVTVFWACVLGGFVATPIGVAPTYETHNEANRKLYNAWRLLGEPVVVADDGTAAELAAAARLWEGPGARTLPLSELDTAEPAEWLPGGPDAPVLNLFTSGSTGTPKCVQHTHASIAARTWSAAQARGYTAEDVSLVWMPLDHITLAMFNVRDVFLRALHVNARTADFLADPLELLRWIDRYRVTNVLGSNFAYALVNEAHGDGTDLRLDLSCVREFINAGEGVDPAVSHRFLRLIGRYGAPPDVMTPAWGMSETCSAVSHATQSRDDRSLGTVSVRRSSVGGDVVVAGPGDDDAVLLSTVGAPIGGVEMRIVDPGGRAEVRADRRAAGARRDDDARLLRQSRGGRARRRGRRLVPHRRPRLRPRRRGGHRRPDQGPDHRARHQLPGRRAGGDRRAGGRRARPVRRGRRLPRTRRAGRAAGRLLRARGLGSRGTRPHTHRHPLGTVP